jgi:mono/diheme cytochrome c family protein
MTQLTKVLISWVCFAVLCLSAGCARDIDSRIAVPRTPADVKRGKNLVVGLAACGYCHGETRDPSAALSGGLEYYDRFGRVLAPNLTLGSSDKRLSTSNVISVMRSGKSLGEYVSKEAHDGYQWLSDDDLLSIVAYLQSLPARKGEVERRSLSSFELYTWGAFEKSHEVRGAVPRIKPAAGGAYGGYLVKNVARCGSCHDGLGGMFSPEDFLQGGKAITNEHGVMVAPSLRGLADKGWTPDSIKLYLATGRTPEGKKVHSYYCPTAFYKEADENDLVAIAQYLISVK